MRPISPTSFAAFVAIALALTLSACGNKEERIHHAETEGIYVNVGPMKYQVQISRALNPAAIPEDRVFVEGAADSDLAADEVWFAVFVRVENESDEAHPPAEVFEIEDQQGNMFEPVELPETNPFHWDESPVRPHGFAPGPDTIARQLGSIGGMLQLYRLKYATLDHRPLELIIKENDSSEEESVVELDV